MKLRYSLHLREECRLSLEFLEQFDSHTHQEPLIWHSALAVLFHGHQMVRSTFFPLNCESKHNIVIELSNSQNRWILHLQ